jgi:PST family polysaccharide transporter
VDPQRPALSTHPWTRLTRKVQQLLGRGLLRKIVGNTAWQVTEKVLRLVFGLLVGVWIARYLGPVQFGLLNYSVAFVALFAFLSDVGLQAVLVRDLVRRPGDRVELLASAVALRFLGGGLAVAVAVGASWMTRRDSPATHALVLVIALGMLAQSLDVIEFDYQARMTPKPVVTIRIASLLVFSIVKLALIAGAARLIWFAAATTGEAALSALLLWMAAKSQSPVFRVSAARLSRMRDLLASSWPLAISSLSVILYMRIDQVMLGQMLGDRAVGIFSAAVRISESWYFVPMAILSAVAPALTAAHQHSEDAYRARLLLVTRVMIWLAVVLAAAITLFARPLILALYGSEYSEAATVLAVHAWAGVFASLGVASSPWFINAGLLKLRMLYTMLGALVNVAMNTYMIPHYGVVGAAVATLVSYCLTGFLMNAASAASRPVFILQVRSMVLR